ncbi:MAG: hypothetical protein QM696_07325 [Steroidobacteraceae bacterium]
MKIALAALAMLLATTLAFAADVDGTWNGTLNVTGSDVPVAWTFKAEGDVLTGGVSQAGGPLAPIKDGKIDGNKISFVLQIDYQGMQMSVDYTGVVSPDEIKLTGSVSGQSFEYVVRK